MGGVASPNGKVKYGNLLHEPDRSVVSGRIVAMQGFVPTNERPIIYLNGGNDLTLLCLKLK